MSAIDFQALRESFEADEIEWRVQQSGEKNGRVWAACVPYVTNRAIQNRLDEVVGAGNWRNEFTAGPGGGVLCGLSIRIGGEWVTKWDGAENTGVEGVKGGLSSAMKRAAVQWGIGRYLYGLDETFANVHEGGRFRGKTRGGKAFRWDPPRLPASALPRRAAPAAASPAVAASDDAPAHEEMLEFVRSAGARLDGGAEIRLQRRIYNLRDYVREHWGVIKEQPAVARTVVQAIERATGERFVGGAPAAERRAA